MFLLGFVIFVKVSDRFGSGERRKKRNEDKNILDKLRDLISS